ncbi:hypothetical protein KKF34_17825 [Myxococcota bacterium]|nr:hypothetical protein [Myxococcota bacterium]MBU1382167.1 hypothetical protein [Myxococcota bacterium]MBU1498743.1 hypothetical protein [Myxococcota bacterium]
MLSLFMIVLFLQSQEARILFPSRVVDFEKLVNDGNFKPIEDCPKAGGFVAGWEMSLKCSNVSGIKEVFVSGEPVSDKHTLIPWEVEPEHFATIIRSVFSPETCKQGIHIMTSRRLHKYSILLSKAINQSGLKATSETMETEVVALKSIALLYRKRKQAYSAILPLNDPGVITPLVLRELLQLQFRRGIPLIVRSRHEVFTGGLFAVEPIMTLDFIKNPNPQTLSYKKYFNPKTAFSLGLGGKVFEKNNFMAMTR